MGQILIKSGHRSETHYLLESNVLGRDRSLGGNRISNRILPLFWLEIRYFKSNWAWRILNGEDQTKGSGAVLADGWRNFSYLISFPEITVEMIDSSPPETLIEDLLEDKFLLVDEVEGLLVNEGGYFLCGETIHQLENYEIFVLENKKRYRLWIPEGIGSTEVRTVSIYDEVYLECDLRNLQASFTSEKSKIVCKGEVIRLLAAYASERKDSNEGWLSNEQVFERWLKLGGNSNSDVKRMNWERNKLCNQLYKAGLSKTMGLFERKRVGVAWYHRLKIEPEQIFVKQDE